MCLVDFWLMYFACMSGRRGGGRTTAGASEGSFDIYLIIFDV